MGEVRVWRVLRQALVVFAGLVAATSVQALVPQCIDTAAGLQAALTAAETDKQPNYIALVAGTYTVPTALLLNVTDGYGLTLEGGYTAGCASAPAIHPANTVIVGANGARLSFISNAGLTVRNLSLTGFKPPAGTSAITLGNSRASALLRVEDVIVTGVGVNGINDSILQIFVTGGLYFHDNLVHDNGNADASVRVQGSYAGLPVVLANNTIAKNAGSGLVMDLYSVMPVGLFNNILWNNTAGDLIVAYANGNLGPLALANTWLTCTGCAALSGSSANNSSADPKLTAGFGLGAGSPAINRGVPVPTVLDTVDAAGNGRVQGSAPDQGAYESAVNDFVGHTYTVTSTADNANDTSTLRGAITAANAAGVPAWIRFQMASCPQTIFLTAPLPSITVPLLIDGYADVNSSVNTLFQPGAVPFNAKLCAIVFASGSVDHALAVDAQADPAVHVEVRGLRFENFATAVHLSGGAGHWVHGNAFAGGFIYNSVLGNGEGVRIDGGFADVLGGPRVADVNLLGGSSGSAAVVISGGVSSYDNVFHWVVGNSIGGDPGGTGSSYGNADDGVRLEYTRAMLVWNNWVVANGGDGVALRGATYTSVQGNRIGSLLAAGLGNGGAGVHLAANASFNWIGPTDIGDRAAGGNTIEGNAGPGAWIDLDAAAINQVANNSIDGNGGLAIDLAAIGPTADSGSENAGPNALLHKPTVLRAADAGNGQFSLHVTVNTAQTNGNRYLTVYASDHCGDARQPLGTFAVAVNAQGVIDSTLSLPQPAYAPAWISATEGSYTAGASSVSEISGARRLLPADGLYSDGFDCY